MSDNTSATGGYLTPVGTAPLDGDPLLDAVQAAIVGITGMDGTLVRPSPQPDPPPQPPAGTDWCSFQVTRREGDDFPSIVHDGTGDGSDTLTRHETVEMLASFIGPACQANASVLRDGFYIPQNIEALMRSGIALLDVGEPVSVPDLVNLQWINRCDLAFRLRRQTERTYQVLNLVSAAGVLQGETISQPWQVEP